ncbi:MAG: alkaline phosphatase [Acidobacteria bacterium]|nr:MAG: alkaline phosphatase [Acidobacteriota bacterium]
MRAGVIACALGAAACGAFVSSPSAPGADEVAVLVGAGDIAVCGAGESTATGRLLDNQPGTIFVAGDIAYPDGTAAQFRECYEPAWGRHKDRTRPAPGNHEYGSPGAAPYFSYFGSNAGPAGLGYYRYRKGAWLVFSLNSNTEGIERWAQLDWLGRELAAQSSACAVAYFHHPRFSSGSHGTAPPMAVVSDLWRELYSAGVDVVISAHEHFYERFGPQTPDGTSDVHFGLRQFIVGTGGAPLTQPVRRVANSEAVLSVFGVLRLTLEPQSYRWEFLGSDSGAVLDSGAGPCHGPP